MKRKGTFSLPYENARLIIEAAVTIANNQALKPEGFKACYWLDDLKSIFVNVDSWIEILRFLETKENYSKDYFSSPEGVKNHGADIKLSQSLKILEELELAKIINKDNIESRGQTSGGNKFQLLNLPSEDLDECLQFYEDVKLGVESGESIKADIPKSTQPLREDDTGIKFYYEAIPFYGTARFTGRKNELTKLHNELMELSGNEIFGIVGMGGVGKTELCLRYIKKRKESYPGGICWITGEEKNRHRLNPTEQLLSFGRMVGYRVAQELERHEQLQRMWDMWQSRKTLLIFDDVSLNDILALEIPPKDNLVKVITSRDIVLGQNVRTLKINELQESESFELFGKFISEDRASHEKKKAEELMEFAEFHPLAIGLLGGYLRTELNETIELQELLSELKDRRKSFTLFESGSPFTSPLLDEQLNLYQCFQVSWDQLDSADEKIACVIATMEHKMFEPQFLSIILEDVAQDDKDYDLNSQRRTLEKMVRYSLIKFSLKPKKVFRYHALFRDFVGTKMSPEERELWGEDLFDENY